METSSVRMIDRFSKSGFCATLFTDLYIYKERQDQERDNKIENRGDRYNRKSEVHERTVGRTCSQNEEHQVGENNIRVDTQRWKTTKRKTQKEMERWHRGSRWQSMDENGPGSKCMAQVVEAICQQWHERLRWWWYKCCAPWALPLRSDCLSFCPGGIWNKWDCFCGWKRGRKATK